MKEKGRLYCIRNRDVAKSLLIKRYNTIIMNKTTMGLGAAALFLGIAGLSATALAYRGDMAVKGPNYTPERHEAMEKAFENNDYATWKKLMEGRGNVSRVVTQANFSKFAQIHELMEDGKTAEAQKVRQELGLGKRDGSGYGMNNVSGQHMGRGMGRQ